MAVFGDRIYAGYQLVHRRFEDGEIVAWECNTLELIVSLDQHKSAVSSLVCNDDQTVMVSAGQDCRIIIWDLLSEESSTM